ncbi:MAG: NAD(P)H-hydrate dehydratase, partial [Gemmatimonadota bacterium]|nr:NAD(P)H-hydrate dehydratase [Gemmatimonadota bacterium]
MRAGAGKLQIAGPRSAATALGVAIPEARVFSLPETDAGLLDKRAGARALECTREANAILIGPGMLNDDAIRGFMETLLP